MNLIAAVCLVLGANVFDETFDRANANYQAGRFTEAIQDYEQLVGSSVVDADVFYNLGNAYHRNGDVGRAIANYERALQLVPDFRAARENLDEALRITKRGLEAPVPPAWEQALLFWHYGLSYGAVRLWAVICWVAFWTLLALRQWKPRRFLRRGAVLCCAAALLFTLAVWTKSHPPLMAVAAAETVPVRFGTSEEATVRFELFEGDRVFIDEQKEVPRGGSREPWVRIVTVGGERGWARRGQLAVVGPPYEPHVQPSSGGSP